MSENYPDQFETVDSEEQRRNAAILMGDFRGSFKYSQGNEDLQNILFSLLRDHYAQSGMLGQAPVAIPVVAQHIERFVLPPRHKTTSADGASQEFIRTYGEFGRCLLDPWYRLTYSGSKIHGSMPLPIDHGRRVRMMPEKTAQRDKVYLADGRPQARLGHDPYESYFRTYILGGAATHSDAYNTIFTEAREAFATQEPSSVFNRVKSLWEKRHPGDNFYPPFAEQPDDA